MIEYCKVIGCRAGAPAAGVPASGYLLEMADELVLVDCGPGVVLSLKDVELENLTGVVVTHRHADHMLDLMALAYRRLFPRRQSTIPLYCPSSMISTLNEFDDLFGIPSVPTMRKPILSAFDVIPVILGESFAIGTLHFDTLRMVHPVDTMALALSAYAMVYTSDGGVSDELREFCTGARFLFAEATYVNDDGHDLREHGHMTARLCGELAASSGIEHLIVTHLSDVDSTANTRAIIRRYYDGEVSMASPGLKIRMG